MTNKKHRYASIGISTKNLSPLERQVIKQHIHVAQMIGIECSYSEEWIVHEYDCEYMCVFTLEDKFDMMGFLNRMDIHPDGMVYRDHYSVIC